MVASTASFLANTAATDGSTIASMEAADKSNALITGESIKVQSDSAKYTAMANAQSTINNVVTACTSEIKEGSKHQ